jgi:hypothetical protein
MLGAAALPVTARAFTPVRGVSRVQIQAEPHCLSQESASGYGLLVDEFEDVRTPCWIAPAARELSAPRCRRLIKEIAAGAWLLLESGVCFSSPAEARAQADILRDVFKLALLPPIVTNRGGVDASRYVQFCWPVPRLVRTFQAVIPIAVGHHQVIATFQGNAVGIKTSIGKGGIIYLGTMLGPGLLAQEREARDVTRTLIQSVA